MVKWSAEDVEKWLELGYTPMTSEEIEILVDNEVDGETLLLLTEDLLTKMDFSSTMAMELTQTIRRDRNGVKGKPKGISKQSTRKPTPSP